MVQPICRELVAFIHERQGDQDKVYVRVDEVHADSRGKVPRDYVITAHESQIKITELPHDYFDPIPDYPL